MQRAKYGEVGLAVRRTEQFGVPPGRTQLGGLAHNCARERVRLRQGDTVPSEIEQPPSRFSGLEESPLVGVVGSGGLSAARRLLVVNGPVGRHGDITVAHEQDGRITTSSQIARTPAPGREGFGIGVV